MDVVVAVGGWEHQCCGPAIERDQLVDLGCLLTTGTGGRPTSTESPAQRVRGHWSNGARRSPLINRSRRRRSALTSSAPVVGSGSSSVHVRSVSGSRDRRASSMRTCALG